MLDLVYKLRHLTSERRRWNAAAALRGLKLSRWMRQALNRQADDDLSPSRS